MIRDHNESEMACHGAETVEIRGCDATFERCVACGTQVRWDLRDHHFFGFQTCECAPSIPLPAKEEK